MAYGTTLSEELALPDDAWMCNRDEEKTPWQNIVLDIDETMAHTRWDSHDLLDILDEDPDADHVRARLYILDEISTDQQPFAWGSCRPYLRTFLRYVRARFRNVIVWTAGTAEYAHAIVPHLFRGLRPPDRVYSREHCMVDAQGGLVKPLHWITSGQKIGHGNGDVTLRNTFVVDDNPQYVRYNRRNALVIPRYSPKTLLDFFDHDCALLRLMSFFEHPHVRHTDDVRQFSQYDVFGEDDSVHGDL